MTLNSYGVTVSGFKEKKTNNTRCSSYTLYAVNRSTNTAALYR